MLVLTPTRELALQVQKATHGYCTGQRLLTACLVGGVPFGRQLDQVRKPVDIVIATPGRLKDHMDRGSVDLGRVELLVLDEADRMLDMGFQEEIDSIVGARAEGAPDAALLRHPRRRGRPPRRPRHAQPASASRSRAAKKPSPTSPSTPSSPTTTCTRSACSIPCCARPTSSRRSSSPP